MFYLEAIEKTPWEKLLNSWDKFLENGNEVVLNYGDSAYNLLALRSAEGTSWPEYGIAAASGLAAIGIGYLGFKAAKGLYEGIREHGPQAAKGLYKSIREKALRRRGETTESESSGSQSEKVPART